MKWFKEGLNADELKKAYRDLARQHHPDISKDPDATRIMQEINTEFDEYFTRQTTAQYSWVKTASARYAAKATRKVIIRFLTRDKESKWLFVSSVHKALSWSWLSIKFRVIADTRKPEWKDFTGGFAACEVNIPEYTSFLDLDSTTLDAKRVPAKITPATLEEIYWYLKESDVYRPFDYNSEFYKYDTKFGDIYVRRRFQGYGPDTPYAFMKVEYYDETLVLGEGKPAASKAAYNARLIQEVQVPTGFILHSEQLEKFGNDDIPYHLYQDCCKTDFEYYHDVNTASELTRVITVKPLAPKDIFIGDYPIVEYLAKKGIIKLYASAFNFRVKFGYFDRDALEMNMHMLTIEDAETIQDYLDTINKEFDEHVKSLIKSGKVKIKI